MNDGFELFLIGCQPDVLSGCVRVVVVVLGFPFGSPVIEEIRPDKLGLA